MSGAVPSKNAMSEMMMPDDTGYETASVIQMMTEKIRMPIMRCPADERSGGVGSASTAISTRMAMGRPILWNVLCGFPCGMRVPSFDMNPKNNTQKHEKSKKQPPIRKTACNLPSGR